MISPTDGETGDPAALLGGRRLVLVSNREPYTRTRTSDGRYRFQRTTGGLVSALDPVMRASGGVWVAWDPEGNPDADLRYRVPEEEPGFTLRRVPLTSSEVRHYYYGFANRSLWPLCHYFVDRCHFDLTEWRAYQKVNRRFADAVLAEAQDDDVVWIHDYHFTLLPQMVRERQKKTTIAFFLHIPFPTEEVFRILPWRRQILEGLLGADLVAFHTSRYAGEFLGCCDRILGADVDHRRGTVRWKGRTVRVKGFPIGIDVPEFEAIAAQDDVIERAQRIRTNLGSEKVILGVDRLDYSKGILERLEAIDYLFEHYPQHRGNAVFVQVAVPSRTRVKEYRHLKRQIDETVGRINGRFSEAGWAPIRYLYRSLPRPELVAYYRAADIGLVSPLRDGMNLVAKEYCASRIDGDGILVLSEFTGAAEELGDGALSCNPFSTEETAAVLDQALQTEGPERRRRMALLRQAVKRSEIHTWLANILTAVNEARAAQSSTSGPVAQA